MKLQLTSQVLYSNWENVVVVSITNYVMEEKIILVNK